MKTISIKQPWAHLICTPRQDNPQLGIKDIENRTWPTKFRGRVLVHASAGTAKKFKVNLTDEQMRIAFGGLSQQAFDKGFDFGAIIGSVEIVDCVINHPSIWAEKSVDLENDKKFILYYPIHNWVLANPVLFAKPIPAKGKLSFWDYPNILAEPEEEGGELFCHCQLPVKLENQVMPMADGTHRCRYCGGKWYK